MTEPDDTQLFALKPFKGIKAIDPQQYLSALDQSNVRLKKMAVVSFLARMNLAKETGIQRIHNANGSHADDVYAKIFELFGGEESFNEKIASPSWQEAVETEATELRLEISKTKKRKTVMRSVAATTLFLFAVAVGAMVGGNHKTTQTDLAVEKVSSTSPGQILPLPPPVEKQPELQQTSPVADAAPPPTKMTASAEPPGKKNFETTPPSISSELKSSTKAAATTSPESDLKPESQNPPAEIKPEIEQPVAVRETLPGSDAGQSGAETASGANTKPEILPAVGVEPKVADVAPGVELEPTRLTAVPETAPSPKIAIESGEVAAPAESTPTPKAMETKTEVLSGSPVDAKTVDVNPEEKSKPRETAVLPGAVDQPKVADATTEAKPEPTSLGDTQKSATLPEVAVALDHTKAPPATADKPKEDAVAPEAKSEPKNLAEVAVHPDAPKVSAESAPKPSTEDQKTEVSLGDLVKSKAVGNTAETSLESKNADVPPKEAALPKAMDKPDAVDVSAKSAAGAKSAEVVAKMDSEPKNLTAAQEVPALPKPTVEPNVDKTSSESALEPKPVGQKTADSSGTVGRPEAVGITTKTESETKGSVVPPKADHATLAVIETNPADVPSKSEPEPQAQNIPQAADLLPMAAVNPIAVTAPAKAESEPKEPNWVQPAKFLPKTKTKPEANPIPAKEDSEPKQQSAAKVSDLSPKVGDKDISSTTNTLPKPQEASPRAETFPATPTESEVVAVLSVVKPETKPQNGVPEANASPANGAKPTIVDHPQTTPESAPKSHHSVQEAKKLPQKVTDDSGRGGASSALDASPSADPIAQGDEVDVVRYRKKPYARGANNPNIVIHVTPKSSGRVRFSIEKMFNHTVYYGKDSFTISQETLTEIKLFFQIGYQKAVVFNFAEDGSVTVSKSFWEHFSTTSKKWVSVSRVLFKKKGVIYVRDIASKPIKSILGELEP